MYQSIVITSAAVGLAAVAALLWFWWRRFPKRQVDRLRLTIRDPKARADVEDNLRKTIGQLIGGAAVLIGAALAYVQFTQQQQASQQQFTQQEQASHDLLISNQVSKGFEQLGQAGSDKVVVRLGGIYALEGVMNTSEQYHQPVLEALSAFVRDGTRTSTGDGPPATDIQAALTVIGRRAATGTGSPDLAQAHIPKADLNSAYLSGADLTSTNLSGTNLSGANLTFADLTGANLSDANLSNHFRIHTTKRLTYIREGRPANLSQAILLNADLRRADLSGVDLSRTNLSGAILNGADLRAANLRWADLLDTGLSSADLFLANLSGADLSGATVSQEQLGKACGINVKLDPGLTLKPCE
jgi:uncharacterized protein YjbI with pentapeptide repeats